MEQVKTKQQQQDYELITSIWHMLRDFGDIKNDDADAEARWAQLLKISEEAVQDKDDNNMSRFFVGRMLGALEDRSYGRKIGEGAKRMREEIAEDMCNNYCKYLESWNVERDGELYESEICKKCPMTRLCA